MPNRVASIALLLPVVALGACAGAPPADPQEPPISDIVWRWAGLVGPQALEVARPGRYTLELEPGGRYTFRADCNTGGGTYTLDGDRLALGPAATTLADCGPDSLGGRFVSLLGAAESWTLDGERLVLGLARGRGEMTFEPPKVTRPTGLGWLVTGYNNGKGGVVSVAAGTSLTAVFGADSTLSGSAGCNHYSAGFDLADDSLSIEPPGVTRMACAEPAGVMEQEAAFLAALRTVARWRMHSERLELRRADGARALDLVSAVTGTVTYRARRALTPDAEVHVRLEDVSLADAPAVLVGEQRFLARGRQVPLPFAVIFDPSDIDPRHTYNVSATIAEPGGRVLFRTTRAFRVITRDAPQFDVEVVLDLAR